MTLEKLDDLLRVCYSSETCYPNCKDNWSATNKTLGHCAITSLIVNDYFGGQIAKCDVNEVSHYFNIIDNKIIDLTREQFNDIDIDYNSYKEKTRNEILNNINTKERYILLKNKLELKLIDSNINECKKCVELVEKFPDAKTVFLGKDNEIVLIGEAPANNGWRKSSMLWKDINGKVLPSGVILQKLFDIIDRDIFATTFLESVKCYPKERKNLKKCSLNCKEYMLKQLEILKPKLIITLGEFPTRNLLNYKFNKFSDVVGKFYKINNYYILPIYHPSPISPKSYNGNLPIFYELKKWLNKK